MHSLEFPAPVNMSRLFSAAARQYDEHAVVQKKVADDLWHWARDHLQTIEPPEAALDVGCGTGALTHLIRTQHKEISIFPIDLAHGMIKQLSQSDWLDGLIFPTLGDGQSLHALELSYPRPALLASSMCAQWFDDINQTIASWLDHAEVLVFSVLLDGSFAQWRQAHEICGQPCGLRELPNHNSILKCLESLQQEGQIDRFFSTQASVTQTHASGKDFVKSLKAIGANQPRPDHKPAKLRDVLAHLARGMQANYELGFYCAIKPSMGKGG